MVTEHGVEIQVTGVDAAMVERVEVEGVGERVKVAVQAVRSARRQTSKWCIDLRDSQNVANGNDLRSFCSL